MSGSLIVAIHGRLDPVNVFAGDDPRIVPGSSWTYGVEEALRRVRAALAEARERWHAMLAELGLAAQEPSEEGLGQARQEWTRRQDRLQARRQFNRDWAAFLHGSADELVRRLPDLANLIAAPLDGFDRAEWLAAIVRSMDDTGADFVAGRIRPIWSVPPPAWMSRSGTTCRN